MKNQAFLRINPPSSAAKSARNRGNAIIISLVVISLMGILTAMLMRSAGRITNNYSNEEAQMEATHLLRKAQEIEGGVSKLTSINGCGENAIDFTNTKTTKHYEHSPVSPDGKCKVFDVDGAGLTYAAPPVSVLDTSKAASTDYGDWIFTGSQCILKAGTGEDPPCAKEDLEMLAVVRYIRPDVCIEINNRLKIPKAATSDGIPTAGSATGNAFTGTFDPLSPGEIGDAAGALTLVRQLTGCFADSSSSGTYTFYHTLLVR